MCYIVFHLNAILDNMRNTHYASATNLIHHMPEAIYLFFISLLNMQNDG